jgi:hypothetical protein
MMLVKLEEKTEMGVVIRQTNTTGHPRYSRPTSTKALNVDNKTSVD